VHKPTTAGPQPRSAEHPDSFRAAGAPVKRDGFANASWTSLGKQKRAEVWCADGSEAQTAPDSVNNRYYGRSGAMRKEFNSPQPAQVMGGKWYGPSSGNGLISVTTPPTADKSPAATPPDEAEPQHWGRKSTPWHDTNRDQNFSILGGAWCAGSEDKPRKSPALPTKPSAFCPPRAAYSDAAMIEMARGCVQPSSPTDAPDECSRPVSAVNNNLGRSMAGIMGHGGEFDMRASMGGVSSGSKPNLLKPSDLLPHNDLISSAPKGLQQEPQKCFARGRNFRAERDEQKQLEADGLAIQDVMGTGGAFLGCVSDYREHDFVVNLKRNGRRRPLSAKPNDIAMRQSQVARNLTDLVERHNVVEQNRQRHGGTVPW